MAAAVGLAQELNSGFTVATTKALPVSLASAANTAPGIEIFKSVSINQVVETDSAYSVAAAQGFVLGIALDNHQAFPVEMYKIAPIGLAVESDSGLDVTAQLGSLVPDVIPAARSSARSEYASRPVSSYTRRH